MMPNDQFHIFVCPGVSEPSSGMLPYLFAHGYAGGSFPNSFQWHAPIGASEFLFWNLHVKFSKEFLFCYPVNQALFTRPLGPGKWASNIRIVWFSFSSFGGCSFGSVSFGSSAENAVDDALAQGADGLGLMKNEDHQVLENKQKLEEDPSDCTRVDDISVEFSLEAHSCKRLLLKAKAEFPAQPTMRIQGAGLDELKHDLSTEEYVAQKCKDAIVKNKSASESSYFVPGANIELNKAGSKEVADLDPNQLPT
nr:hypothetical protein [Tanacetum cinerariifolium]